MNSKVLFDEDGWKRLQDEVPKVLFILLNTIYSWIMILTCIFMF